MKTQGFAFIRQGLYHWAITRTLRITYSFFKNTNRNWDTNIFLHLLIRIHCLEPIKYTTHLQKWSTMNLTHPIKDFIYVHVSQSTFGHTIQGLFLPELRLHQNTTYCMVLILGHQKTQRKHYRNSYFQPNPNTFMHFTVSVKIRLRVVCRQKPVLERETWTICLHANHAQV